MPLKHYTKRIIEVNFLGSIVNWTKMTKKDISSYNEISKKGSMSNQSDLTLSLFSVLNKHDRKAKRAWGIMLYRSQKVRPENLTFEGHYKCPKLFAIYS